MVYTLESENSLRDNTYRSIIKTKLLEPCVSCHIFDGEFGPLIKLSNVVAIRRMAYSSQMEMLQ